jgi:hypothetical protein
MIAQLAGAMLGYRKRALAKDAAIGSQAARYFLDLTRETSNASQPISAAQVAGFSFLDRARKELRQAKQERQRCSNSKAGRFPAS